MNQRDTFSSTKSIRAWQPMLLAALLIVAVFICARNWYYGTPPESEHLSPNKLKEYARDAKLSQLADRSANAQISLPEGIRSIATKLKLDRSQLQPSLDPIEANLCKNDTHLANALRDPRNTPYSNSHPRVLWTNVQVRRRFFQLIVDDYLKTSREPTDLKKELAEKCLEVLLRFPAAHQEVTDELDQRCSEDSHPILTYVVALSAKNDRTVRARQAFQACQNSKVEPLLQFLCAMLMVELSDTPFSERAAAIHQMIESLPKVWRSLGKQSELEACFVRIYVNFLAMTGSHAHLAVCQKLVASSDVSPFLLHLTIGEVYHQNALLRRGNWDEESIPEGNRQYIRSHNQMARDHYLKAWTLRQDVVSVPLRLLAIEKDKGETGRSVDIWLRYGLAVDFDDCLVSYPVTAPSYSDGSLGKGANINPASLIPEWIVKGTLPSEKDNPNGPEKVLNKYVRDCNEVIRIAPAFAPAYVSRGLAKNKLKNHEDAITDFDVAIHLDSACSLAYFSRGRAKSSLDDVLGAIADFDKAIVHNPQSSIAYHDRGVAKKNLKDELGAIADFTETMHLDPNIASAYYNRGVARSNLKEYSDAIADFSQAINLNPKDAKAFYNRGAALMHLSKWLGAKQDFEKSTQLAPESDFMIASLSFLLSTCPDPSIRQPKEAEALATRCLRKNPRDPHVMNARACALAATGDFAGAIQWQKRALANTDFRDDNELDGGKFGTERIAKWEIKELWLMPNE